MAKRLVRRLGVAIIGAFVIGASAASAQDTGLLLFTDREQIPLKTYAEFLRSGVLRISSGSLKDIPTIDNLRLIRCSRTGWRPVAVMAASEQLFTSEYAERRLLPIVVRPVGVTAVSVRVADLDKPERIAELYRAIGAPEGGDTAFFFLIYTSGDITQYYPFRIRQSAKR